MDFFMTSESDSRYDNFEESLRVIRNEIENTIKPVVEKRDYGKDVQLLAVIPIIIKFDQQMEDEGWFKERVLYKKKSKETDIRLRIDYVKFVKGNDNTKRLLLIDNIIKSIDRIVPKTKDFDHKTLKEDILSVLNVSWDDLQKVK